MKGVIKWIIDGICNVVGVSMVFIGLVALILVGGVCLIASLCAIALPALLTLFGFAVVLREEDMDSIFSNRSFNFNVNADSIGKVNNK